MKQYKKFYSNKLISNQLKKAILIAFKEAKKYNNGTVNSKFIIYGLLKVKNSLAAKSLNNLFKLTSLNKVDKILKKCKKEFRNLPKVISLENSAKNLNFSRPIRRVLFSLLLKINNNENISMITTFHFFFYLVRNKSLSNWIKGCLLE